MRVRRSKNVETIYGEVHCVTNSGGDAGSEVCGPFRDITTYEAVIYDIPKPSTRFKPCSHEKFEVSYSKDGYYTSGPTYHCDYTSAVAKAMAVGQAGFLHTDDFSFDWWAASGRAYAAMKPTLSSDLNMTVFTAELRDFSSLFKLFDSRHGLVKNSAGGYLNYQFGWKPMIRDIKTLLDRVVGWEYRYQDYLRRQNTLQQRRYSESIAITSGTLTNGTSPNIQTEIKTGGKGKYTATMRYVYTVPTPQSILSPRVRAFMDTYGINLNPSTIWELLPFSFVVDWFVRIGDWLKAHESDWLEPVLTIQDFCHSVSYSYSLMGTWSRGNGAVVPIYSSASKKYFRRVGIPNTSASLTEGSAFTPRRLALASSLVIVNTRLGR